MRVATRRSLISRPPVATISDWWTIAGQTCVAAYQAKGNSSLAASYTNLANPGTYDAAPGVAPTWAAGTGWTFDGTQFLTIGTRTFTYNTTLVARIVTPAAWLNSTPMIIGAWNVAQVRLQAHQPSAGNKPTAGSCEGNYQTAVGQSALAFNTPYVMAGVFSYSDVWLYRNGVADGLAAGAGPVNLNHSLPQFIGTVSTTDNAVHFNGSIQAVAIYSTTLSADDVAVLTTRMQSL